MEEVVRSTRIQGAAWRQFARKRETVGRTPFTVPQVKLLQAVVCGKGDDVDRLLAGLAPLLTSTRLRFVDAQRARQEPALDTDKDGWAYVEAPLGDVKTNTVARPQDKNPATVGVGHALGFGKAPWARGWLALRRKLRLDASKQKCLVPAPTGAGGFLSRRLRSHEFTAWLRAFMKTNKLSTTGEQCGAHSGKSTTLSWCGKAHVPRGTIRALGYRVLLKDKMVKVYSRDYQAGPLRKLEEVEAKIDEGDFDPDVTRSGRFR